LARRITGNSRGEDKSKKAPPDGRGFLESKQPIG
jgi:hypothetical protein